MEGGYEAEYAGTRDECRSHDCYIKGMKHYVEAHFGGIVIQAIFKAQFYNRKDFERCRVGAKQCY